eukprot:352386-Chlamydomonas_euryale.AAC.1
MSRPAAGVAAADVGAADATADATAAVAAASLCSSAAGVDMGGGSGAEAAAGAGLASVGPNGVDSPTRDEPGVLGMFFGTNGLNPWFGDGTEDDSGSSAATGPYDGSDRASAAGVPAWPP